MLVEVIELGFGPLKRRCVITATSFFVKARVELLGS